MAAFSHGHKPWKANLEDQAAKAAAEEISVMDCAASFFRRIRGFIYYYRLPWAYAHGYMLPSLSRLLVLNLKKCCSCGLRKTIDSLFYC